MGQQQLLLLVLGIVIVGIAVVAGIQAFSEGRDKAQADAAVSDAMRILSDLQAWYLKPVAFGGGGEDATNWDNVKWSSIGIRDLDGEGENVRYQTVNGCFSLTASESKAEVNIYHRVNNACAADEFATATVVSADAQQGITWVYK